MVIISVVAAGMVPLFTQVISNLHVASEGVQGHYLAHGIMEQMDAKFAAGEKLEDLENNNCLKLDGTTPWMQDFPMSCQMDTFAVLNPTSENPTCVGIFQSSDLYKCLKVTITHTDSNETIVSQTALFSQF